MADTGNIFDNSVLVTPSLQEGQVAPIVAEGDTTAQEPVVTPDEGQVTTDPVVPTTDPDWKKDFKSDAEMYAAYKKLDQSYKNLRPEYTKVTQELSVIRKGSQPVVNQPQADPQTGVVNPVDALLSRVAEIVAPVKEQNDELVMQNQVAKIMQDNPDFNELAPTVAEILKAKPFLWNDESPIETALELARAKQSRGNLTKAVADVKAQVYADKELKILNSVDNKTQPHATIPDKTPEQIIKDGILGAYSKGGSIF